ncbi:hypothetical protein [Piscinibacter defluvii]|uniref:hypothetical protein n=1 Tax=Piscinibacter defluvii TaxID=1796922 RepID=UPI000FDD6605|nr:hypothetical protein [Piscinibacter defluvii]
MALPVTDLWSSGTTQGVAAYGPYAVLEGGFNVISGSPGLEITSGAYNTLRRTGETFNAAQFSQVVITAGQISTGIYCGPAVRCQSGANTSYHAETNGSDYYVSKCVAGTQTVLAGPITLSTAAGDVFRIEIDEVATVTTISVYKALAASPTSFSLHAAYTDTASPITAAGDAGVFGYGSTPGTSVVGTWTAGNLSTATAEQEGFRFGVDDGSESAHTWAQAQDTNDTVSVGTARLIRALINGSGDLPATAYTLRYQKNGAGGYVPVPVGSGNPTTIGAPAFNGVGAGANATTSSGSLNVSYPSMTGATSDTALYLVVTGRHSTADTAPTVPGGWTLVGELEGGTGTFGADAGTRRVSVYRKDTVTGSESGTIAVSFGGTTSSTTYASIVRVDPPSAGYVLSQTSTTGQDTSAGTAVSIAGSASLDYDAAGDLLLVCHASPSDTGGVVNSPSLTASGSTFGSLTSQASIAVTGGNDHRHVIYSAVVTAAGSAAAPTFAYTASGTNSGNASGPAVFLRIRATLPAVTNQIFIDASANIAAGGEATTARLTAPSGKSTSDFVTGRRWDDENGADSIDLTIDDYTELEWRITTQTPAADGDYFDFRVYAGSAAFNTYTVTPRLTLGSAAVDMPPQLTPEPQAALLIDSVALLGADWSVNVSGIVSTLGPASSTGATGRAGARGDSTAAHGAPTVASGRAGALGGAPFLKESPSAASGRVGVRAEVDTVKAAAAESEGRLAGRGSVVSAEGAVHVAAGRLGARGSAATIPAFGVVTQATGRARVVGDATSSKIVPLGAAGRAGATGSALAAKGSAGGSDGRAGPRSEAIASKSVLHGASGSLAVRGAALAAEGAVHSATGRIGARASVSTAAAFGATTVAGGRVGARGSSSSAKATAGAASGRACALSDTSLAKAIYLAASGRIGLRGLVDTSGIPPVETTAGGRLGVRGEAITVLGGTSSSGTGTGGVGRLVTPSYRMQPPRRKRRPGEDQQQVGTAVDLAPGPLAGTAAAAPAPAPIQPAAEVDRWRLAREQDLEFETKVLHLV